MEEAAATKEEVRHLVIARAFLQVCRVLRVVDAEVHSASCSAFMAFRKSRNSEYIAFRTSRLVVTSENQDGDMHSQTFLILIQSSGKRILLRPVAEDSYIIIAYETKRIEGPVPCAGVAAYVNTLTHDRSGHTPGSGLSA